MEESLTCDSIVTIDKCMNYQDEIDFLDDTAKNLLILDEFSAKAALTTVLLARKLDTTIDENRQRLIKRHLDFQRIVNGLAKTCKMRLDFIQTHLKANLETWICQQEGSFFEINELEVDDGKCWTSEEYDFEILDHHKIPTVFLKPDDAEIKCAIKEGIRYIAGINIFKTKKLNLRVKN